jgi:hypothetical protein
MRAVKIAVFLDLSVLDIPNMCSVLVVNMHWFAVVTTLRNLLLIR